MTTQAWIVLAAVVAVVLVALLVVGLVLRRRRRVGLGSPSSPAVEERPTYKAGGGFDLRSGGAAAAPPAPSTPAPTRPRVAAPPAPPVPPVERTDDDGQPRVGDDASVPRDSGQRGLVDVALPDTPLAPRPRTAEPGPTTEPEVAAEPEPTAEPEPAARPEAPVEHEVVAEPEPGVAVVAPAVVERDEIAPTEGRLERLRGRLARSQGAVGQSLLGLLGAGDLDEDAWEEVEDTLLVADLGNETTQAVITRLREQLAVRSVRTPEQARALLKEVLVAELSPELDRSLSALPHGAAPAVLLVVGVNGTGKTTTTGKLARVLVADGRRVLLGAADTFRAAAADQLQTWADRVGAEVVRGKEGADPAAVAFDAVSRGTEQGVDAVLIDTAGRLHTKTGLMDELGKVKRVVEKKARVDEVLLVLDATTGQNGLTQARVFSEVVTVTGVVLTKLDGTAKGGIVFQVQRELGVPVKLVGLGEGADDLAPFEPAAFVDALLG